MRLTVQVFHAVAFLLLSSAVFAAAPCKISDPTHVVIYLAFNGGEPELQGAREGACTRGERLVAIPSEEYLRAESIAVSFKSLAEKRWNTANDAFNRCKVNSGVTDSRCQSLKTRSVELRKLFDAAEDKFEAWKDDHENPADNAQESLRQTLDQLKKSGQSVSSLILSGHDGGGEFYGDVGESSISKEDIFNIARDYPQQLGTARSVILLGCWSAVPFEVEMWKANMPSLKVIAGFGGSAPAVTVAASGQYAAGILKNEPYFHSRDENEIYRRLSAINDINRISAAVYVDPSSGCAGLDASAYYALFAQMENRDQRDYKPGINRFSVPDQDTLKLRCETFSINPPFWKRLNDYFEGKPEPTNNRELTGLYDQLRQNEKCYSTPDTRTGLAYSPDQILMLRFFQEVKKNFAKYFAQQIADGYKELDEATPRLPSVLADKLKNHHRLMGDAFIQMTRAQTLTAVSELTALAGGMPFSSKTAKLAELANEYLYALRCLDPHWHEYDPKEKLVPPTCGSAAPGGK